jgi:hypothetical protein
VKKQLLRLGKEQRLSGSNINKHREQIVYNRQLRQLLHRKKKKKKTNSTEMSALTSKLHALTIAPPQPRDELTDYLLSNLNSDIQKLGLQGYSNSSLIEWWYKQRHQWPTLSRFTIEILSIAAMSDDVERVFSGCRRTISWERARLGLDKVEAVECLGRCFPLNAEDEVGGTRR